MSAEIVLSSPSSLPSLFLARPAARTRLRDFFSSHLRNPNTRRAYLEAVRQFSAFCAEHGIVDLAQVEPVHVAAFVEAQLERHSRPTVKLRLAALRMIFDWMVVGQVMPVNPAHAVRGPKHTQRKGKTPVLAADEARALIDAIDTDSLPGLRDRALIGLMVYTFARVGAAVSMKVEDYFVQGAAVGSAFTRKAARSTRCRSTTISTATSRSTSPRPASRRSAKVRSFARARGVPASWQTGRCCNLTDGV
jgi:site-specific recombinase XerD